jgi:hypothetical protein
MRMRAWSQGHRQTTREKGHPALQMPRPMQKKTSPQQSRKADPPNPQHLGKNRIRVPKPSRPPKESFDIRTIHDDGDPAAEIWFDRRDTGDVEIKSFQNRAFANRGAICDVHFFRATGRARCSLLLETEIEIGMLLER